MSAYHSRIPPETSAASEDDVGDSARSNDATKGVSAGQAFANISAQITELKDYAGYYIAAKLDGIKWSMTRIGVFAALGLVALIIGAGLLVTATVLFLTGLATGLGRAFEPDMIWLGWTIVGGLVLAATAIGAFIGLSALTKGTQKRMAEKYENKRQRQQVEYGTNVRDRAASAPEPVRPA